MFESLLNRKLVAPERALRGREHYAFRIPERHTVLGTPLQGPWPVGTAVLSVGMGCFWGAERAMWRLPGVVATAVGYQGGFTPFPTYEEVCTGLTGHTEVVRVAYDPRRLSHEDLLRAFWTGHDPTQGFRQGNDRGTQYRSSVYATTPEQEAAAEATRAVYQEALRAAGYRDITTEIRTEADAGPFYYAEAYHQQYLDKNPNGYCGLGGTGVACPLGVSGEAGPVG